MIFDGSRVRADLTDRRAVGDRASRWVFAACAWVPVGMIVTRRCWACIRSNDRAPGVGRLVGVSLPVLTGASGERSSCRATYGLLHAGVGVLAGLALVLS